jgi:hypothetical protein
MSRERSCILDVHVKENDKMTRKRSIIRDFGERESVEQCLEASDREDYDDSKQIKFKTKSATYTKSVEHGDNSKQIKIKDTSEMTTKNRIGVKEIKKLHLKKRTIISNGNKTVFQYAVLVDRIKVIPKYQISTLYSIKPIAEFKVSNNSNTEKESVIIVDRDYNFGIRNAAFKTHYYDIMRDSDTRLESQSVEAIDFLLTYLFNRPDEYYSLKEVTDAVGALITQARCHTAILNYARYINTDAYTVFKKACSKVASAMAIEICKHREYFDPNVLYANVDLSKLAKAVACIKARDWHYVILDEVKIAKSFGLKNANGGSDFGGIEFHQNLRPMCFNDCKTLGNYDYRDRALYSNIRAERELGVKLVKDAGNVIDLVFATPIEYKLSDLQHTEVQSTDASDEGVEDSTVIQTKAVTNDSCLDDGYDSDVDIKPLYKAGDLTRGTKVGIVQNVDIVMTIFNVIGVSGDSRYTATIYALNSDMAKQKLCSYVANVYDKIIKDADIYANVVPIHVDGVTSILSDVLHTVIEF